MYNEFLGLVCMGGQLDCDINLCNLCSLVATCGNCVIYDFSPHHL